MNEPFLSVKKNIGEMEQFSKEKFLKSLQSAGANQREAEAMAETLIPELYDGITTDEIHKKALDLLRGSDKIYATKYNLKRAIFDLGPSGYPFERLVRALLEQKGFTSKVGVILKGIRITHEIDVLAEKDGNSYVIECKFHSGAKTVSNVQVPLYIQSRFLDVQKQWNADLNKKTYLKQAWLVTNTRFTKDAIEYAKSVDLTLLSWDYPKNNGLKKNIDNYCLYPVTTLTTLTKEEKVKLIAKDIILIKELFNEPHYLKEINLESKRIVKVLSEIKQLCSENLKKI